MKFEFLKTYLAAENARLEAQIDRLRKGRLADAFAEQLSKLEAHGLNITYFITSYGNWPHLGCPNHYEIEAEPDHTDIVTVEDVWLRLCCGEWRKAPEARWLYAEQVEALPWFKDLQELEAMCCLLVDKDADYRVFFNLQLEFRKENGKLTFKE